MHKKAKDNQYSVIKNTVSKQKICRTSQIFGTFALDRAGSLRAYLNADRIKILNNLKKCNNY